MSLACHLHATPIKLLPTDQYPSCLLRISIFLTRTCAIWRLHIRQGWHPGQRHLSSAPFRIETAVSQKRLCCSCPCCDKAMDHGAVAALRYPLQEVGQRRSAAGRVGVSCEDWKGESSDLVSFVVAAHLSKLNCYSAILPGRPSPRWSNPYRSSTSSG